MGYEYALEYTGVHEIYDTMTYHEDTASRFIRLIETYFPEREGVFSRDGTHALCWNVLALKDNAKANPWVDRLRFSDGSPIEDPPENTE